MEGALRDTQIKNPFVGLIIGVSMTVKCIKPNVLREKCLMLYSLVTSLWPALAPSYRWDVPVTWTSALAPDTTDLKWLGREEAMTEVGLTKANPNETVLCRSNFHRLPTG